MAHRDTADTHLELRIHGVNNTSPASMLDLPADGIDEVLGDHLAGFWRPKPSTLEALGPEERGWVPPGITREAYSWGGLARTAPGGVGAGTLATLSAGLSRLGWALLLPFGLANVAYWSRRLGDEVIEPEPVREAGGSLVARTRQRAARARRLRHTGVGAGSVRLFGLGLTLLTVVTACELSMDLIGTQCFRGGQRVCGELPGLFDWLAPRSPAVRLVLTALLPVVMLVGLWLLSAVTRSRYERAVSEVRDLEGTSAEPAEPRIPVLATPGFWLGDRMVSGLAHVHLGAGLAMVAVAVAWPALFGTGDGCADPGDLLGETCWDQVGAQSTAARSLLPVCLAGALIVLLWACIVTWLRASDAPDVERRAGGSRDKPKSFPVLVGGAVVLTVTSVSVMLLQPELSAAIPLPGVSALPTILAVMLFSLVGGAFTARFNGSGPIWSVLLTLALLAIAASSWFALVTGVLVAALVVHVLLTSGGLRRARRWEAWSGTGPGILLGAAFLVQGMLSSLVVLGAGDWLNGANSASSLIDDRTGLGAVLTTGTDACGRSCPAPDPLLHTPVPYVLFGTGTLLTAAAMLAVVLVMLVSTGNPTFTEDEPEKAPPAATHDAVRRSQRLAAVAHRAEKLIALLVLIGLFVSTFALIFATSGWVPWEQSPSSVDEVLRRVTDLGTAGVTVLALAVLGALVGGALTGKQRPLGLVWDLICFLPRAAHPFGPPCYAERSVPELSSRVNWWLDPREGADPGGRGRAVVLSAHSLGGVLAVAVILGRRLPDPAVPSPVRLLTFGSQLRAYFGRILPELLGPGVLGTPPVRAALLWSKDPWKSEIEHGERPDDPFPGSVAAHLTGGAGDPVPLWRNLWRRTDYLGFPVVAYDDNVIDRRAEEIDRTGYLVEVVTHSNYPRARAYEDALIELIRDEAPPSGNST